MTNYTQAIKEIILQEFSSLIKTIEGDFIDNYKKKINNFLLNQLDEKMTANMVFVSSFESKSGFAIETCAKRIATLKYGPDFVPAIVNPKNLNHSIDKNTVKGQIIVTNVNTDNGELRGKIAEFRASNVGGGKGASRQESGVNQQSIKSLLAISEKYKDNQIHTKPVDLAFFDGSDWNIMELKAGGDLDSSNAPSNVEKILTIYAGLNVQNSKLYFATLYNKNGEGKTWTGAIKKHLCYPDMFLIGKNFWDLILPQGISFASFTSIYKEALTEINLNERINIMIKDCLGAI